jgi:riboflavin kinase
MAREIVELEAVVCSGLGEGRVFTRLDWAEQEFRAKLGYSPYPGTFNLQLRDANWPETRARWLGGRGAAIVPPAGFCAATCYPVQLEGRITGAAVFPDVPGYPPDKVEVIAPVSLREALGVADGDVVKLRIEIA